MRKVTIFFVFLQRKKQATLAQLVERRIRNA